MSESPTKSHGSCMGCGQLLIGNPYCQHCQKYQHHRYLTEKDGNVTEKIGQRTPKNINIEILDYGFNIREQGEDGKWRKIAFEQKEAVMRFVQGGLSS